MEEIQNALCQGVKKNQKHSGTLREIGISNQVKKQVETNHKNKETVAKFQTKQAQTVE